MKRKLFLHRNRIRRISRNYRLRRINRIVFLLPIIVFIILISISLVIYFTSNKSEEEIIRMSTKYEIPGQYLIDAKQASIQYNVDFIKILARSTLITKGNQKYYNKNTLNEVLDNINFNVSDKKNEKYLYVIYIKSYQTLKVSPLPKKIEVYSNNKKISYKLISYTHCNDFGYGRTYGGDRKHMGNDLMAEANIPIVSITDGKIVNKGWNTLGGWRIGIKDKNGTYFYYAHMMRYSKNIKEGQSIKAGQVIGYVGNSGYGPQGTYGKFKTHLHVQIGIKMKLLDKQYTWINPYPIIQYLESTRETIRTYK